MKRNVPDLTLPLKHKSDRKALSLSGLYITATMKTFHLLLLSLFMLPVHVNGQQTNQLTPGRKATLQKANRHEKNGWIYLHIEGNAEERGFQHGYLMAGEIMENIRLLKTTWIHDTALEWSWYLHQAEKILTPRVEAENLAEIDGIAEGVQAAGSSVTRSELVALNGYPELKGSWWSTVKDSVKS